MISYAALASLALVQKKNRPTPPPRLLPTRRVALCLGIALLLVAALVAIGRWGGGLGFASWIGQLSVAGVMLVLLMSWRPRIALLSAPWFLAAGFALVLAARIQN
ncbi:MAG: DUF3325 family protein [Sphingomonas sp.]|nr:DUF3325 family protein [Sphingomonas sp.]